MWKEFEKFDAWWADAEKSGSVKSLLANGFVDKATVEKVAQCIQDLKSNMFQTRQAAREKLATLVPPIPPAMHKAAKDANPEVAMSVEKVIQAVEERSRKLTESLQELAEKERNEKSPGEKPIPSK